LDLGIARDKVQLIYHGVDTKKFSPVKRDPDLFFQIFGNSWPVVTCIRGFNPIYDPETFIRAIPLIINEVPETNFLIGGKGFKETRIRTLADNLKVSRYIRFCGQTPHEKIPPYLASSDVYVSVSLSDGGVAVSTFEAMASGVAVVVSDVGDTRLWINDHENGFVVPVRSPAIVAEKVVSLLLNPALRAIYGQSNRTLIEQQQDYYKEMEKVHTLYKDLVKEGSE
jgi:phosphatidylinositol alpha-1,6-mannosyltransferase